MNLEKGIGIRAMRSKDAGFPCLETRSIYKSQILRSIKTYITMAKVFITKYALTVGIKEIETDIIRGRFENREYVIDDSYSYFRIGENAFTDKSEALKKAEEMKIRKIASLRKQIEKLEKLSFKVEEI